MNAVSEGFGGRRSSLDPPLPPGQYLTRDFPVLSAGPTPRISRDQWQFSVRVEGGHERQWDFAALTALGAEDITVDLHCVTGWSKLGTSWRGVPVEAIMREVGQTSAGQVLAHSYGGYTTNLPLVDLLDGRAWLAFDYEGTPLAAEHGGPVRLLVPHLYLWKSAKWVRELTVMSEPAVGFWEGLGYHSYGDPWLEQRYWRD